MFPESLYLWFFRSQDSFAMASEDYFWSSIYNKTVTERSLHFFFIYFLPNISQIRFHLGCKTRECERCNCLMTHFFFNLCLKSNTLTSKLFFFFFSKRRNICLPFKCFSSFQKFFKHFVCTMLRLKGD